MDNTTEYRQQEQQVQVFSAAGSRMVNGLETFDLNHLRFRILSYHRTLLSAHRLILEHEHPNYEFSFMYEGSMTTICENHHITASAAANRIFFVPPLTFHNRIFGPEPYSINETMLMMIDGLDVVGRQLCRLLPAAIREKGYSFPWTTAMAEFSRLFAGVLSYGSNGKETGMALLKAWLGTFLLENFPDLFDPVQLKKYCNRLDADFANDRVNAIKNVIENSFATNNPIRHCAQRFKMSSRHLNRIFKEATGLTLNQYLTQRKLEAAENMLCATRAAISEIAASVGFASQQQFAVFFRKQQQCSPSEFRRRHQQMSRNYL